LAGSTTKAPTASELGQQNEELRDRVDALELTVQTLIGACQALELGIRAHRPLNLSRPENMALRAVLAAAGQVDRSRLPFVLPMHSHYVGRNPA
jgi:hypothetical protein